jgi:hypothetical protein
VTILLRGTPSQQDDRNHGALGRPPPIDLECGAP